MRTPKWEVKLAAKDVTACAAWLGAISHALPHAPTTDPDPAPDAIQPATRGVGESFARLSTLLLEVRVIRGALSEAETQLVAAQRLVDDHICRATEQMRSQLQPRTLSRVYLLSPFRSPNSQHRRTETTTLPPGGSRANLGSSAEQLRQLRQLNSAIRAEIRPKLMQIRSMQKVVVALNTDDWWWFVRLGDGFTLWESWRLAVATQTQLECSRRAAVASRPASGIDPEQGSEGQGSEGSEGRTVRSALQGLWSAVAVGTTSVDPDTAGRNNAATRKEAEQEAEEDWFISIANKIFEV
uniref:Uncharacterized protein n=1 Tax=Haptolina ericina TaxID=156174 RepID=A0A7S3ASC5_9EUKA